MKVVFCNQLTEMLGVQTLSACLKQAGHETDLVFEPNLFATGAIKEPRLIELLSNDELVIEDILALEPDLVGFPVEINGYHWALKIAAGLKARRPDLPIIAGGIHATMCPEVVAERPELDGSGDLSRHLRKDRCDGGRDIRNRCAIACCQCNRVLGLTPEPGGSADQVLITAALLQDGCGEGAQVIDVFTDVIHEGQQIIKSIDVVFVE